MGTDENGFSLNPPRCKAERWSSTWPYSTRCNLPDSREHFGLKHTTRDGEMWVDGHYEDWFKSLWNEGLAMLEAVPEEATEPGTPWHDMMEAMHGIAEDQPWLYDSNGQLRKIED